MFAESCNNFRDDLMTAAEFNRKHRCLIALLFLGEELAQ
jgi:hypothetical protein